MKIKPAEPTDTEADMTPMIDMVFQLIAFFMVLNNFEQTQADERVKLPVDQLARPPKTKRDAELVLNVGFVRDAQGHKVGAGLPLLFYSGEAIPIPQFKQRLLFEKNNYEATGVNPKEVTVIIRGDAETPTGAIQDLVKLAQETGFEKFALKAKQDE
jgi:biopolymer transport protein ExbD